MKAFVSPWRNKAENTWYLVAQSKVTSVFELSRIFQCLTPLAVLRFSEVQTNLTKQAIKWTNMPSHPHQIVSINLVAFIKQFSDVWFFNF